MLPADLGPMIAVPLSDYAVRYHRPGKAHRGACGVRASWCSARLLEAGEVFESLDPCAVCWPELDVPLSPWELFIRQLRMWDAHGAWEDPRSRYGRAPAMSNGDQQ